MLELDPGAILDIVCSGWGEHQNDLPPGAGVKRSEDMGHTWVTLTDGLEGRPVHRLLFPLAPASGAEIFAATDQGVWRSADGGLHWQRSGLNGRFVLSLGTFPPPLPVRGKKKG